MTAPDTPTPDAPGPAEPQPTAEQQRLLNAVERFQKLNGGVLPAGVQGFNLPPNLEANSALDGLARLLIEKGVITTEEFVAAKHTRMAEVVEESIEQAEAFKREHSGLVMPGPAQTV